jgi:undecaprenyl-diphosphatase
VNRGARHGDAAAVPQALLLRPVSATKRDQFPLRGRMNTIQAVLIAVLQGATELFPVSSLGHAVVVPALLDWPLDEHAAAFLPFLVMLHLGTATALLLYFWRDWLALLLGVLGGASTHQAGESRRVLGLIVVATIPAVVVGFALEKFLLTLFGTPLVAATFLVLNGLLLLFGERIRARGHRKLSSLTAKDALLIDHCGRADARHRP